MKYLKIYTDGSCKGNPGKGGWCAIIDDHGSLKEISGKAGITTNNRMELIAVIKGLEALSEPCRVTMITDSLYIAENMRNGRMKHWAERRFLKENGKIVKNPDLWIRVVKLCEIHNVRFVWRRGHGEEKLNRRCDAIARQQAEKASQTDPEI